MDNKKYKINFIATYIDLTNDYNKTVKWVSDIVKELEEFRPYIKTSSILSFTINIEPTKELINHLQEKVNKTLLDSALPLILKDLKYVNTEIIYKENK